MIAGKKIIPDETLIIFDEIQECPEALNTLKYFKKKANEYHVIAAGSLLSTLLAKPKSYPVGMVNLLNIYPLTFDEFLDATDPSLYTYYDSIQKEQQIEEIFHSRLLEACNNYLIIGGMPECVASWIKYKDPARISWIQRELIEIYENDFSKHNGKVNSGRILMVFRSIVAQLAKPNEKFMYGVVREGGRARDFEEAIEWLVSAGMLNRVYNVSKMEHPLSAFDKLDQFKLFVFDTGLLKHMAGIDNSAILLKTEYQFKGPLTENYVLQQLRGQFEVEPRYYSDKNSEIDFVLQYGTEIIPVEAKSGEDKSAPSFKRYVTNYQPKYAIRYSKRGYRKDGNITNLPLYLARKTRELL
jgi:predicted AAA+ superfamily ATPase